MEVDIIKPLKSKFSLKIRVRTIEYEMIHLVCFNCGIYGHHKENCSLNADGKMKKSVPHSEGVETVNGNVALQGGEKKGGKV